jgi:dolichol-phosphate mannosyltransferase
MIHAKNVWLSVLILARNESENLGVLLPRVSSTLDLMRRGKSETIVVDADSPDGTADVARRFGARVVRQTQSGYANALRQGFSECTGDFIVTLDADLSHGPEVVTALLQAIDNADIVIASRYIEGGAADMPTGRRTLSIVLNRIFGVALRLPIRDLSSGFRIYRRTALEQIHPRGNHFDVLPEIVALACLRGFRVREVAFHYRDRTAGISKARVLAFMPSYLHTLFRCMREKFFRKSSTAAQRTAVEQTRDNQIE